MKLVREPSFKGRLTPRVVIFFTLRLVGCHMSIFGRPLVTLVSGTGLNLLQGGASNCLGSHLSSLVPGDLMVDDLDQLERSESFLEISFEAAS